MVWLVQTYWILLCCIAVHANKNDCQYHCYLYAILSSDFTQFGVSFWFNILSRDPRTSHRINFENFYEYFSKKYIAVVPLVQYITGFCVSFAMKPLAKHLGKVSTLQCKRTPSEVSWTPGPYPRKPFTHGMISEWNFFPWCNPNNHCIDLGNNSRWGYVLFWCLHFGISFWCWNNNSPCSVACNHCWAHWREYIHICFCLWCHEFNRFVTFYIWCDHLKIEKKYFLI